MNRTLLRSLMITTSMAIASVAHAQDSAVPAGTGAEQVAEEPGIIVQATRRSESLQDVAMSVDVATGEDLQKLNIFDAKDIQQLSPGLELTNTTGRNNTTTLRGITFDPDQGTGPAVQVYMNDLPVDAQTAYTAIFDIRQIEVLRGPQGLLRGLSAPAGAITIATRRPSFDAPEGYVQATATDRAGYNVQGGVSLPLSDIIALRVSGLVDGNRINHVSNVNRGDRSYGQTQSVRATLGFRPNGAFSAYLTYQYLAADNRQYQQVAGTGNTPSYQLIPLLFLGAAIPDASEVSGPPLSPGARGAVAEGAVRNRNETHLVNLAMDYDLGPATLSFVGAHQYSLLRIQRDLDTANAVPNYIDNAFNRIPYKVDSAELRLTSNGDEGFGWGVGAFYTKQTGTTLVEQGADRFFFPTSVFTTPSVLGAVPYLPIHTTVVVPVYSKTWSFNANLRFKSGPFKIEGGLRYSLIRNIQRATVTATSPGSSFAGVAPFTSVQDGIPAALTTRSNKPLTGGVNIGYEISGNLNVYAAYGHSFRVGSTGVAVPVGLSNDLISTNPEKTDSWELGVKGSAFNRRVTFAAAGFYQKLNGYLSRFPGISYNCPELFGACFTSPPAPAIDNSTDVPNGAFDFNYNADATIKGVEASIDARPTSNWDFGIAASYARARFDNARVPCNDYAGTGRPNQAGNPRITGSGNVSYCLTSGRLAEAPDFSLTANTEVRFPVGKIAPYVRALFTYRPAFFSERVNYRYDDRELLNVFLGIRTDDGKFDLNLFARNLLNQQRITDISGGNGLRTTAAGLSFDSGYRLVNTMNPREFGVTGTFNF